jgi:hypothetical protein
MGLTCGCFNGDWYPEPGDWYYNTTPNDYRSYPFKRGRKCCSCGGVIKSGEICTEHDRVKTPESEIERKIYGDDGEIPIASDWMCEKCSDLYYSLTEIGYCVWPRDKMGELLTEHIGLK